MAAAPNYASVALPPDIVQVSGANTNRDGTGTLVAVTTGTANGVVLEQVRIEAPATTTAGMIRFFLSNDGGATKRLFCEKTVTAIAPSGTTPAFSALIDDLVGLTLQNANTVLYAATHNAETFNIFSHKAGL